MVTVLVWCLVAVQVTTIVVTWRLDAKRREAERLLLELMREWP